MNRRSTARLAAAGLAAMVLAPNVALAQDGQERTVISAPATVNVGTHTAGLPANGSFWVINTGDEPARLSKVKASCGCTTVKDFSPLTLAPGEGTELHFSIKAPSLAGDWKTAAVTIAIDEQSPLAVPIQVTAADAYTLPNVPVSVTSDQSSLRIVPGRIEMDDIAAGERGMRGVWLINTSASPVNVSAVKAGCGCISFVGFEQTTLNPGQATSVHMRIKSPKTPGTEKDTYVKLAIDDQTVRIPVHVTAAHPLYVKALEYRAAGKVGDTAALRTLLADDSRIWFHSKEGPGTPRSADGKGPWSAWDEELKSRVRYESHRVKDNTISFTVRELNEYMKLLERSPARYTVTYWFDDEQRIEGTLIASLGNEDNAGEPSDRLPEFLAWAEVDHAQEIARLMPNGEIVPSRENAKRWRELLTAWRESMTKATAQRQ